MNKEPAKRPMTVNKDLYQPYMPILQDRHRMKQLEKKYGHLFQNEEQFEAFAMLPVSDSQRPGLIRSMKTAAKNMQLDIKEYEHKEV